MAVSGRTVTRGLKLSFKLKRMLLQNYEVEVTNATSSLIDIVFSHGLTLLPTCSRFQSSETGQRHPTHSITMKPRSHENAIWSPTKIDHGQKVGLESPEPEIIYLGQLG